MAFVIRNWLVIAIFSVMAVKNPALCITEKVSEAKPPTRTEGLTLGTFGFHIIKAETLGKNWVTFLTFA